MFFSEILNFLYKKSCLFCNNKKENSFFCSKCRKELKFNEFKILRTINEIKIYSCCNYSGIPQKLVRLLKFHNKKFLSSEIAKLMKNYTDILGLDFSDYEIICVPMHKLKKKKRGFNQCELISVELSKLLELPYNFDLIKRIKNTKPMYNLKINERIENLKDAFEVNKKYFHNKKLLLIDDIITTGTTISEIIKSLKKEDITEITCLSFTNTDKSNINIK
ncbi:ComF family protein [bacterium]|nr:ComF family protein [bacterium]